MVVECKGIPCIAKATDSAAAACKHIEEAKEEEPTMDVEEGQEEKEQEIEEDRMARIEGETSVDRTVKMEKAISSASPECTGIFIGTAEERAIAEQQFQVNFSPDARLWQNNRFAPLQGGTRFHRVSKCESADEAFNKNLNENIVAVVEYGYAAYPEVFRPRKDFCITDPTGGKPPNQIWSVRGYVDESTRVVQLLKADGSTVFALCTVLDLKEGEHGAEATIQYLRGGFKFAVTVVPIVA